jgi:hypothetical protein
MEKDVAHGGNHERRGKYSVVLAQRAPARGALAHLVTIGSDIRFGGKLQCRSKAKATRS